MTASKASPEERIMRTYSSWRASSGVSMRASVMPITPFIGVRISWLMLARNADLSRELSSASACS